MSIESFRENTVKILKNLFSKYRLTRKSGTDFYKGFDCSEEILEQNYWCILWRRQLSGGFIQLRFHYNFSYC